MNNAGSADGNDEAEHKESQFTLMQKSELEALAIAAIKVHRRLIDADEAVYEEWTRASSDPTASSAVVENLQREYTARQQKSEAQQEELSEIIDALGYVPDVAPDVDD
ncbi:transcriptional repressor TraM [Rhizobium skierniewicense]|uniref:transcriptional repressor TraM n=1 Tax=Rhizobium/Agrobacterium group TaxID=227290 RepID=UPI00080F87AB|nr:MULTISPECIES: transcriptional repressor TraM [Rhizobium]MDX8320433.1 transcriptional repressor TraM [Agrobacterium sp. rho-8.1]OCJ66535.1 transcriptional regulator [Agrobacterium tumefaciens]MBD8689529.1 transcriptional repressor TraM [Rhizobium sp. CFBP 13644]MBD8693949.1 transcriptional repressor TraM [Rhizobium sp. CFBP 13717]MCI9868489.1 transcriptional repressor TraM [Rhizobium skierniewicense]